MTVTVRIPPASVRVVAVESVQNIRVSIPGSTGGSGGGGPVAWGSITDKPTEFPPEAHTHPISEVDGLQDELDGKEASLGFTPENVANKGQANGYAPLDGSAKIDAAYLPAIAGAVNLASLGYTPATGDVRTLVATAAALSPNSHVIIPAASTPWISGGEWIIDGITVEFETGAKVDQQHADVPGIRLQNQAVLIKPWFTSTTYPQQTLVGIGAGGATSHAHNARAIWIESAGCKILDIQMLEFMAAGIYSNGYDDVTVTNLTARYLRSYEGYASAIDLKGVENAYVTVNTIEDCDRAMEPEDGSRNCRFIAAPGNISRVWSRYYDQVGNPNSDGFCLSAHSHLGQGITQDIYYEGHWTLTDCAQPIYFTQSTALDANMPHNCHIEHATIVNTAAFPTAQATRSQVWIDGHGCSVKFSVRAEGASIEATLQGVVNKGVGNKLTLWGPDVQAALPWIDSGPNSIATTLELFAADLTVQPSVPANAGLEHLIHARGVRTVVKATVKGVQNRGYVRLDSAARGSVVLNPVFIMPASAGPNAAIRFSAADRCSVLGGVYTDTSGVSLFVRMVTGATGNLISGNQIDRAAGAGFVLDSGADDNAIVNNMLLGITITNNGAGNTVAPNY